MNAALSAGEKRQLKTLETKIEANLALAGQHYRLAAAELAQVKALCLYRQHGSFEQYCKTRWGLEKSRAYQLLVYDRVSTIVDDKGLKEAHARVLDGHPPEEQRAAWAGASADGGKPTAAKLEELLQADADTQIKTVEEEEQQALAGQPAREERKTRSPGDVVDAILRHVGAIGKLVRHLPDVADQVEEELGLLRVMVQSTTET